MLTMNMLKVNAHKKCNHKKCNYSHTLTNNTGISGLVKGILVSIYFRMQYSKDYKAKNLLFSITQLESNEFSFKQETKQCIERYNTTYFDLLYRTFIDLN